MIVQTAHRVQASFVAATDAPSRLYDVGVLVVDNLYLSSGHFLLRFIIKNYRIQIALFFWREAGAKVAARLDGADDRAGTRRRGGEGGGPRERAGAQRGAGRARRRRAGGQSARRDASGPGVRAVRAGAGARAAGATTRAARRGAAQRCRVAALRPPGSEGKESVRAGF